MLASVALVVSSVTAMVYSTRVRAVVTSLLFELGRSVDKLVGSARFSYKQSGVNLPASPLVYILRAVQR